MTTSKSWASKHIGVAFEGATDPDSWLHVSKTPNCIHFEVNDEIVLINNDDVPRLVAVLNDMTGNPEPVDHVWVRQSEYSYEGCSEVTEVYSSFEKALDAGGKQYNKSPKFQVSGDQGFRSGLGWSESIRKIPIMKEAQ